MWSTYPSPVQVKALHHASPPSAHKLPAAVAVVVVAVDLFGALGSETDQGQKPVCECVVARGIVTLHRLPHPVGGLRGRPVPYQSE